MALNYRSQIWDKPGRYSETWNRDLAGQQVDLGGLVVASTASINSAQITTEDATITTTSLNASTFALTSVASITGNVVLGNQLGVGEGTNLGGIITLGGSNTKARLLLYDSGAGNALRTGFGIDTPSANDATFYAHNSGAVVLGKMGTDFTTITTWMRITNGGHVNISNTLNIASTASIAGANIYSSYATISPMTLQYVPATLGAATVSPLTLIASTASQCFFDFQGGVISTASINISAAQVAGVVRVRLIGEGGEAVGFLPIFKGVV